MSKAAQLSSKEIHKQLANLGIEANISGVRLEYQNDILEAVKLVMVKFPKFYTNGLIIRESYVWEFIQDGKKPKEWISCVQREYRHGKLIAVMLLNPVWFKSKKLKKHLSDKFNNHEIAYHSVVGNICHELGHVLWFQLLALSLNIKLGQHITENVFQTFKNEIDNRFFVKQFWVNTCLNLHISKNNDCIYQLLSKYGQADTAEAFSEVVAEWCTSSNVRCFAQNIIQEYYIQLNQHNKNTK